MYRTSRVPGKITTTTNTYNKDTDETDETVKVGRIVEYLVLNTSTTFNKIPTI